MEELSAFFAGKDALLVLDNFEHVSTAALGTAQLLEQCPTLHVLATSRSALNLYGEQEYPVSPLALPKPNTSFDEKGTVPSIQLLLQCVQQFDPAFAITPPTIKALADIAIALDGLPLALELGAAQLKFMTPETLRQQLQQHAGLRWRGAQNLAQRQRTLADTIDWSYQLLDAATQCCFRRLGVFVGGFTMAAARAVCADADGEPVDQQVSALVTHNLVQRVATGDGMTRYTMLETVRQFSLEQLKVSDAYCATHLAHATYFLAMAEQAEDKIWHFLVHKERDRLMREHGNLLAALQWTIDQQQHKLALQLGAALGAYWIASMTLLEGTTRLDYLRSLPEAAEYPGLHGKICRYAGRLAELLGDYQRSERLLTQALTIAKATQESRDIAICLSYLGITVRVKGNYESANTIFEEGLALFQTLGELYGVVAVTKDIAHVAYLQQRYREAEKRFAEAYRLADDLEDPFITAYLLGKLGDTMIAQGRHQEGQSLVRRSLAMFRELDIESFKAYLLMVLGQSLLSEGNCAEAAESFQASMRIDEQSGYFLGRLFGISACALTFAKCAQYQKAWQLTSFVVHTLKAAGIALHGRNKLFLEEVYHTIFPALREVDAALCWQIGKQMSMNDAIEYALADTVDHPNL